MILFGAHRSDGLRRFIRVGGACRDQRFWRLAQALAALYSIGTDERRQVEGVLASKEGPRPPLTGGGWRMEETRLLERITVNPQIFGGKPIVRGRRLAVEHVLGMLAAGDTPETILEGYPWLEPDDIQACLAYAHRLVGHERVEPLLVETGA
jgi:uncharacterized protein (DUF433 family)